MTALLVEDPMAGKKVETLSVKLHMDVIESARIVSAIRNVSMTDMLSDLIRPQIKEMERSDLAKRAAENAEADQPKRAKKGGGD